MPTSQPAKDLAQLQERETLVPVCIAFTRVRTNRFDDVPVSYDDLVVPKVSFGAVRRKLNEKKEKLQWRE